MLNQEDGGSRLESSMLIACANGSVLVVKPDQFFFNADKGDKDHLRELCGSVPEGFNKIAPMSARKHNAVDNVRKRRAARHASRREKDVVTPPPETNKEDLATKDLPPNTNAFAMMMSKEQPKTGESKPEQVVTSARESVSLQRLKQQGDRRLWRATRRRIFPPRSFCLTEIRL